jgi:dihydroneopterin aldolase
MTGSVTPTGPNRIDAMEIIEIEGMEFYAHHGCYDLEQVVGGKFVVSVRLEADLSAAAASDRVEDTINYLEVYRITAQQMAIPARILEHLAGRILDALHVAFPQLEKATVKVSKMYPPLGGKIEKTSVTLIR